MTIVNLIIAIIALVIAVIAYQKAGGTHDLREKMLELIGKLEQSLRNEEGKKGV